MFDGEKNEPINIKMKDALRPCVIDKNMLIGLIINQRSKGILGDLFLDDGLRMDKVEEIHIEFLNILHVDHLWVLSNLKKLSLSHNIIEKIEGLGVLIHLKELDLSFNNISVMENLNHLNQLEILCLNNNTIKLIEGIDDLSRLTIFNISHNQISKTDHVMYLQKFKNLSSLSIYGNPCAEENDYFYLLITTVSQLIYYNYKLISSEERQTAANIYPKKIDYEERGKKEIETLEDQGVDESFSFLQFLVNGILFDKMFANDADGKKLTLVNESTENTFKEYKIKFNEICREFFELGVSDACKQNTEIKIYNNVVGREKESAIIKSRKVVNHFLEMKTKIIAKLKIEAADKIYELDDEDFEEFENIHQLVEEFNILMSKTWSKLMEIEIILHDQINDSFTSFEVALKEMLMMCLKTVQDYFLKLRNLEMEYKDSIHALIAFYLTNFANEDQIPKKFLDICSTKEILENTISISHDLHLQILENEEDIVISKLNNWIDNHLQEHSKNNIKKNRDKILEISHFMDSQQQDFTFYLNPSNLLKNKTQ